MMVDVIATNEKLRGRARLAAAHGSVRRAVE